MTSTKTTKIISLILFLLISVFTINCVLIIPGNHGVFTQTPILNNLSFRASILVVVWVAVSIIGDVSANEYQSAVIKILIFLVLASTSYLYLLYEWKKNLNYVNSNVQSYLANGCSNHPYIDKSVAEIADNMCAQGVSHQIDLLYYNSFLKEYTFRIKAKSLATRLRVTIRNDRRLEYFFFK